MAFFVKIRRNASTSFDESSKMLKELFNWLREPKNLAIVSGICGVIAFTWNKLDSVDTPQTANIYIYIKSAAWGMGIDIDVTADVARICNGQTTCQFSVDPSNFGGKSPPNSVAHKLRVTYSCDKRTTYAEAMDFSNIGLSCE